MFLLTSYFSNIIISIYNTFNYMSNSIFEIVIALSTITHRSSLHSEYVFVMSVSGNDLGQIVMAIDDLMLDFLLSRTNRGTGT